MHLEVLVSMPTHADDTQLYVHCNATDCAIEAERLTACIKELDNWMTSNRLKLNADKTQIIWIGTRQQLKKVVDADIVLNGHRIALSPTVTCLGVNIDPELIRNEWPCDVSTNFASCRRSGTRCQLTMLECWSMHLSLLKSTTATASYIKSPPSTYDHSSLC